MITYGRRRSRNEKMYKNTQQVSTLLNLWTLQVYEAQAEEIR